MNLNLRLKNKGNRLGPGLISQLNKYTPTAAKTLEDLNKKVKDKNPHKSLVKLSLDKKGGLTSTMIYPGDAQVWKSFETPCLSKLNEVRVDFGKKPIICEKTLKGITKSITS